MPFNIAFHLKVLTRMRIKFNGNKIYVFSDACLIDKWECEYELKFPEDDFRWFFYTRDFICPDEVDGYALNLIVVNLTSTTR